MDRLMSDESIDDTPMDNTRDRAVAIFVMALPPGRDAEGGNEAMAEAVAIVDNLEPQDRAPFAAWCATGDPDLLDAAATALGRRALLAAWPRSAERITEEAAWLLDRLGSGDRAILRAWLEGGATEVSSEQPASAESRSEFVPVLRG